MLKPRLSSYDMNALICLWNMAKDDFSRNKIKMAMIEKTILFNNSMFYLMKKFISSKTQIHKEVYADAILIKMKDNDYYLDDEFISELFLYCSLDALIYYGADSLSYEFNNKCKEEFWKRAVEIENKIELKRKQSLDKKMVLR